MFLTKISKLNNKWLLIIFILILLNLWIVRADFLHSFDLNYLEDLYSHSQWSMATSTRIMSDNELYQLAGYRLIKGADIFSINPEVPPLVKYAYGLSTLLGNPHYASFIFYVLALSLFFLLAQLILKDKKLAYWAVIYLLLSPLFISQLGRTMLDLPQLVWLLGHALALYYFIHSKKQSKLWLVFAGISLGFFAASKFPIYVPLIIIADLWLLLRNKQYKALIVLSLCSVLTYTIVFLPYFLSGNSLIDWLKAEKWTMNFYLISREKTSFFPSLSSIFTGWYNNWWGAKTWTKLDIWNILWPITSIITIILFIITIPRYFKKNSYNLYINLIGILLLISYLVISFSPRYFLLFLPFGILVLLKTIGKKPLLISLITLFLLFELVLYSLPLPNQAINYIEQVWQNGNYDDLYQFLDKKTQQSISRAAFVQKNRTIEDKIQLSGRTIQIGKINMWPWENNYTIPITITHNTDYKAYAWKTDLVLKREFGQWRLVWQWGYLLPNFENNDDILIQKIPSLQGKLMNNNGEVISESGLVPFIYVKPNSLQDSKKTLETLMTITSWDSYNELEKYIYIEKKGLEIIPIGFLEPLYDKQMLTSIAKNTGIVIKSERNRVYNQRYTQLDVISHIIELEKQNSQQLKGEDGMIITMIKSNGSKELIYERKVVNGHNIVLPSNI